MRTWMRLVVVAISFQALGVALFGAVSAQPASWEASFGGTYIEKGCFVHQAVDGRYILLGVTVSKGAGQKDFWLIKTDAKGNRYWNRIYGTPYWDRGRFLQQTKDGGYVLTGYKFTVKDQRGHQLWVIKTDPSGN